MRTSVVVPNKNGLGIVGDCVRAALLAGASEVFVVDDGSTDASAAEAEEAGATVIGSSGRGFAAAVNAGARLASGDALLVLNSDCFLEPDALELLTRDLEADAALGICAAGLVERDGSPGRTHMPLLTLGIATRTALGLAARTSTRSDGGLAVVECVPLACALVRRRAWDVLGGLDERFFFYFEDHDACRRLRDAGFRIAVDGRARATHVGGVSSSRHDPQGWFLQYVRSRARYLRKHYPRSWPVFAVVWAPVAIARSLVWLTRRNDPHAAAWATTWRRAALAGIAG